MPVAETIETEELLGLCREICLDMVPNWDIGAGPRPGPAATTGKTQRGAAGEEQEERGGREGGYMSDQHGRGSTEADEATRIRTDRFWIRVIPQKHLKVLEKNQLNMNNNLLHNNQTQFPSFRVKTS